METKEKEWCSVITYSDKSLDDELTWKVENGLQLIARLLSTGEILVKVSEPSSPLKLDLSPKTRKFRVIQGGKSLQNKKAGI